MTGEKELKGKIFDIQGFSLQDGPGIRTTVFFKGCPLRCPWCHSPESQAFKSQLSFLAAKCVGTEACADACVKACPENAVEYGPVKDGVKPGEKKQLIHVDREKCTECWKCAEACYPKALSKCGTDYTLDEVVNIALRDNMFYEDTGGVTLSGGEVLSQPEFALELLKRLKQEGINTAVDTTGFVKWEIIESVLPYTDLFLYDLKNMDSALHKAVIGVPCELILENAKKIAEAGGKLQIRIPFIPMFNDSEENLRATGQFVKELGDAVTMIQLLPYHNLGSVKYTRIMDNPKIFEATPPSDKKVQWAKEILESYGIKVGIH